MRRRGAETIDPSLEYRKGRACGPYECEGGGIEGHSTRLGAIEEGEEQGSGSVMGFDYKRKR